MAKAKSGSKRKSTGGKKVSGSGGARAASGSVAKRPARKAKAPKSRSTIATATAIGPVTLDEARSLARAAAPTRTLRRSAAPAAKAATYTSVAEERTKLETQIADENDLRIREYKATMEIMERRGVKGLAGSVGPGAPRRAVGAAAPAGAGPLKIFAEGDSWFDYPAISFPPFGGGVIPRLEKRLGLPILNLAKAGDEVRNMLGVKERSILSDQLRNGAPTGGPWDVLLFSGGGNDIVGDPMALWIQEFNPSISPAHLIHKIRFDAALRLVQAGYEDLITLRDTLSPNTHLIFHGYDFALPDGRGVCGFGPWLKPTFDLRKFPSSAASDVIRAMLQQFAEMLQSVVAGRADVTFINTQGTLAPVTSSWHNELHPSKTGFNQIADIFQVNLKMLFPGRVL